jgi:hypothetical protein
METSLVNQFIFYFNFHFTGASRIESLTIQSCWIIVIIITTAINIKLLGWVCFRELGALFFRSVWDCIVVVTSRKLVALLIVSPGVIATAVTMEFIGFNHKGAL